ncbi:hypothetical protein D0469_16890 [Peribacillus saganii]|uniref:Uncharacterized protein n=1 Tax=Peribacillus saganii TaxID=2303992 RepID=A0A372LJY6_9BACI|nr:hypothetical protein [Peribacillus saganii]RFU66794.1 hypothetical protein D0469_16890 [Peribacillus saganii]
MNKKHISTMILAALTIWIIVYYSTAKQAEETIIFFPLDSNAFFESANTTLLARDKSPNKFTVSWKASSKLNQKAYLRQDVSLLYANGRLAGILKNWKQHTDQLEQKGESAVTDSSLFQAITFHYAELQQKPDTYSSAQEMSASTLYVVQSAYSKLQHFQRPLTKEQKEWKQTLDMAGAAVSRSAWELAMNKFSINPDEYKILPLTELAARKEELLGAYPKQKQEEIIGKLWEGLYKNYVLGIKKEDGSAVDPTGSTIPLLLVSIPKGELLVIITSADGTPALLRQRL